MKDGTPVELAEQDERTVDLSQTDAEYLAALKFVVTPCAQGTEACGQKTRPGSCLKIIAQRTLMKSGPRGLLPVEIPSILKYML
jgi:hypothetical protein